jgi:hypothetical protein
MPLRRPYDFRHAGSSRDLSPALRMKLFRAHHV